MYIDVFGPKNVYRTSFSYGFFDMPVFHIQARITDDPTKGRAVWVWKEAPLGYQRKAIASC